MHIYELLLAIGGLGFVVMTAMGFLQVSGHSHQGGTHAHGHGFHAIGDSGHGHHVLPHPGETSGAHVRSGGFHSAKGGMKGARFKGSKSYLVPSPLDIFSICIGAGAAGMLLGTTLSVPLTATVAILAGFFFDFGIIKPLMGAFLKFASNPSEGLEGQVAHAAQAVSAFDAQGRGIVRLTLDGQIVQLLARLDPNEVAQGVRVTRGDQLVVLEVEAAKNSCLVTKELSD